MAKYLLPDAGTLSRITETMRSLKSYSRRILKDEWTQYAGTNRAEEKCTYPGGQVIYFNKTIPSLILT
jgi:hypothetical protein